MISSAEVRARTAQLRQEREAAAGPLSLEARLLLQDEALRLLIDRALILQEAARLLLEVSDEEADAMLRKVAGRFNGLEGCRTESGTMEDREDIRKRILVDKVVDHWRNKAQQPKVNELRKYYWTNQRRFHSPETVHAAHIVCHVEAMADENTAREKAQALRERVSGGEEFGNIAALYSDCPEQEGDLGWFARGVMVPDFDEVIFASRVGDLTPVFRTQFGYHFAVVHARKASGLWPFDEVRAGIESALLLARQEQEVGRALAALQAKAIIRSEA